MCDTEPNYDAFREACKELDAILTNHGIRISAVGRDALIEQWTPFAAGEARQQWKRFGGDYEEWLSEAALALVQASRKYDPATRYGFGCYVGRAIRNRFIRAFVAPMLSLTADDGTMREIIDHKTHDPSDVMERIVLSSVEMAQMVKAETEAIVMRRLAEGNSIQDVARELNILPAAVEGIYERATNPPEPELPPVPVKQAEMFEQAG